MVQLAEGGIKAGGWLVVIHCAIFVIIVIINDGRGHEASGTGVCKGVGGQVLEFIVKSIPFLEKGGGQCCVLLLLLIEEVVVIIIE